MRRTAAATAMATAAAAADFYFSDILYTFAGFGRIDKTSFTQPFRVGRARVWKMSLDLSVIVVCGERKQSRLSCFTAVPADRVRPGLDRLTCSRNRILFRCLVINDNFQYTWPIPYGGVWHVMEIWIKRALVNAFTPSGVLFSRKHSI